MRNALLLSTLGVAAGCALVLLAFATARTLLPFALGFGFGEFFMFVMAVSHATLAVTLAYMLWMAWCQLRQKVGCGAGGCCGFG